MNTTASFPKGPIKKIDGDAFSLNGDDIDTDRIIPARYLKCVSFNSLGEDVFADDRNEKQGEHPFDKKENQGCNILIVNANFGCGSSREHAPQALMRWGIRGIVGESFAEIFYGNCLALGIPCATASKAKVLQIQKAVVHRNNQNWTLDISRERINNEEESWDLNIEPGPKEMLLKGDWDATSQLIANEEAMKIKLSTLPYLNNF